MKDQAATANELSPAQKEEMVQIMMMTFLPVALMVIRLAILALH